MGTSFRNIQIYNPGHKMNYDLEEEYCIEHLVPDWDTIFEDSVETDFAEMREEAVMLSERVDTPVISINYFDDMLFAIEVLEGGESVAYHFVGDEGVDTKNVSALMKALRLSTELEIPFMNIIQKVILAPDCINFMTNLCRVPLDADYAGDAPDSYEFKKLSQVLDEINGYTPI